MKIVFVDTPYKKNKYQVKTYIISEDQGGLEKWISHVKEINPEIIYLHEIKCFILNLENENKLYYKIRCDYKNRGFFRKLLNF